MNELEPTALRRAAIHGAALGFALAIVVSYGIVLQRLTGSTPARAVVANAVTTLVAVSALFATLRLFVSSARPLAQGRPDSRRRMATTAVGQALGALVGVLVIHAAILRGLDAHPWLREHPRQLVNDLVAVFGVLAFVWGCAQRPLRLELMIAGLGLVLGYEATAGYWHLDAPMPSESGLVCSVQRFVGGEVTASGIGLLTFRLLLA